MQDRERDFPEIPDAETERKGLAKTNLRATVEELTGTGTLRSGRKCSPAQEQSPRASLISSFPKLQGKVEVQIK